MTSPYTVTAKRWQLGWELHVEGLGVTQSRSLASAGRMAREYIAAMLDLDDEDAIAVQLVPELDTETTAEVQATRAATRRAEQARHEAAQRARTLVQHLQASGLSKSDVAVVLGVSTQRVSQLGKT